MESHEVEEIKRHFDVVAESLRSDIKAIAEGHGVLNRKIDNLHEELNVLREENQREHKMMMEHNEKEHQKMREENKPFAHFAEGVSRQHAQNFSAQKLNTTDTGKFTQMALDSHAKQQEIEANDTLSFDDFLAKYFSQK